MVTDNDDDDDGDDVTKGNKTVSKLFQNCFETVLFQFHFVARTVFVVTESDLFSLVGRQNEDDKSEQGDDGARDDEVEAVVEAETANVNHERDVNVRMRTARVHHLVSVRRNPCALH